MKVHSIFQELKRRKEALRMIIYFFPVAMIEKGGFQMNINFNISTQKRQMTTFFYKATWKDFMFCYYSFVNRV